MCQLSPFCFGDPSVKRKREEEGQESGKKRARTNLFGERKHSLHPRHGPEVALVLSEMGQAAIDELWVVQRSEPHWSSDL
jgi:hypothetical protein